jgi:glutathione S-transferase
MLELYQFEKCPYSRKVRFKLSELELDFIARNVPEDRSRREMIKRVSGQIGVPVLVDSAAGLVMNESEKIIEYLEEKYGDREHLPQK